MPWLGYTENSTLQIASKDTEARDGHLVSRSSLESQGTPENFLWCDAAEGCRVVFYLSAIVIFPAFFVCAVDLSNVAQYGGVSEGRHQWDLEVQDGDIFFGLTDYANFKRGWGIRGFLFCGNTSNGSVRRNM